MNKKIEASALLLESVQRHNIHLSLLVADTGLWVNPGFHERLLRDTGSVATHPHIRRVRRKGEKRGQVVDGIRLDDNTYANYSIKSALGLRKLTKNFETCHIWPQTCYDERYHTAVANIVLLPRAIAGFSDHDPEIQKALQYRSFELYAWRPEGEPQPIKPPFYPSNWRKPEPDPSANQDSEVLSEVAEKLNVKYSNEKQRALSLRLDNWSSKPHLNVHKIIALTVQGEGRISRNDLATRVEAVTQSKNAYGAIASLLTNAGNAYGCVLTDHDGYIGIHSEFQDKVGSLAWSVAG
jgi:hypothetical protein